MRVFRHYFSHVLCKDDMRKPSQRSLGDGWYHYTSTLLRSPADMRQELFGIVDMLNDIHRCDHIELLYFITWILEVLLKRGIVILQIRQLCLHFPLMLLSLAIWWRIRVESNNISSQSRQALRQKSSPAPHIQNPQVLKRPGDTSTDMLPQKLHPLIIVLVQYMHGSTGMPPLADLIELLHLSLIKRGETCRPNYFFEHNIICDDSMRVYRVNWTASLARNQVFRGRCPSRSRCSPNLCSCGRLA